MRPIASILILCALVPQIVFAAYAGTHSANLVSTSSQHFSRADTATVSPTGNMTLEGWIRFTTKPTNSTRVWASKYISPNRSFNFYMGTDGGPGEYMALCISSTGSDQSCVNTLTASSSLTWQTGVWYHVAAVFTAATPSVKFYVNGNLVSTETPSLSSIFDGTADLRIGRGSSTEYWNGDMALFRLWSTTRTATQLDDDRCSFLGTTTNLGGEWTLNNTTDDNSGNSNTLTNNNTATFATNIPDDCPVTAVPPSDTSGNFFFVL